MKTHKFDVEDAKKYGVKKAVILEHLKFHQKANEGHDALEHDGKTWAFLKKETIEKMYPYFNYYTVKGWLKDLEDEGVIESCKPKSKWGNHIKYYHVVAANQANCHNDKSNCHNDRSGISQSDNSTIVTNVNNTNVKKASKKDDEKNNTPSSENNKKPSAKERTKKYIPLAKRLAKVVRSHINYDIDASRIKSWARDLRLLHEQNGVHPKRQIRVLKWYKKNIGGEYIPEAFSGSSFREKFPKLEAAIKRDKGAPKRSNKPETGYYEENYQFQESEELPT